MSLRLHEMGFDSLGPRNLNPVKFSGVRNVQRTNEPLSYGAGILDNPQKLHDIQMESRHLHSTSG